MSAPVTRRALVGGAVAALTAGVPALAEAVNPASDPDAGLYDLIRRHGEAEAVLEAAKDEGDRLFGVALAAYPRRPAALLWREDDFPRTSCGLALSTPLDDVDGEEVREYGRRAADWLRDRPAATWFRTLSPPLGPECEARRVEILTAFDGWQGEVRAVDEGTGHAAAEAAKGMALRSFYAIGDAIKAHEARTLAGLRAKAAWIAERAASSGMYETDAFVAFAREVAAFGGGGA